ncbi:carboxyl-terminal protease [Mucilaginibacter sp. JRF]|uniref:S41 family peptidase n=1 Tax=Mucilaginibacter sp. JRF TaxID=2780088 RepID=UPI00187F44FA|nr:S41 family peptidase [Mucilaginibacter sp. JRF]MBE9586191.1 carboxyl-terminal protease [Mucilaginibacter sp. JRF]
MITAFAGYMKMIIRTTALLVIAVGMIAFSSCKKEGQPSSPDVEEIVSPVTGTRRQFTLDSIFLYARQVYLWHDALPTYADFDPRNKYSGIATDVDAFHTELFDITQLKLNPATAKPYEQSQVANTPKYSYLIDGNTGGGYQALDPAPALPDDPVLKTAIVSAGGRQVGYVALAWFPRLTTAQGYLDEAFAQIATANPTDVVIDLRSNGGGYVETAEYVANLIAPSSINGRVMYAEHFNTLMQQGKATILRHQPYLDAAGQPVMYQGRAATMADVDFTAKGNTYTFSKKGALEGVKNVYFIVSCSTASASELLISCLKPYFNVKLAGTKTYGKPVGFFGVVIDKYTFYMSSFLISNADGWSDYFEGMAVDMEAIPDNQYELGDPNETCLKKVLNAISGSATNANVEPVITNTTKKNTSVNNTQSKPFNILIENRLKLNRANN